MSKSSDTSIAIDDSSNQDSSRGVSFLSSLVSNLFFQDEHKAMHPTRSSERLARLAGRHEKVTGVVYCKATHNCSSSMFHVKGTIY